LLDKRMRDYWAFSSLEGAMKDLACSLLDFTEYTSLHYHPLLVSSKKGTGFDDVYDVLHEIFA